MVALYKIAKEMRATERWLERDDIDAESFEKHLAGLNVDFDEKVLNIGYWLKNAQADADALSEEIARLQAKKKAIAARISDVKRYTITHMNGADRISVGTAAVKVRVQQGAYHVEHTDELDKSYYTTPEPVPDKLVVARCR